MFLKQKQKKKKKKEKKGNKGKLLWLRGERTIPIFIITSGLLVLSCTRKSHNIKASRDKSNQSPGSDGYTRFF